SAREFNQDVSAAKRAATESPVVITDRGEPAFVLLSIDAYRRLGESGEDLVDRLSIPEEEDLDFTPVEIDLRVPDLSVTCSTPTSSASCESLLAGPTRACGGGRRSSRRPGCTSRASLCSRSSWGSGD